MRNIKESPCGGMVDATDLKSVGFINLGGSSLPMGTS